MIDLLAACACNSPLKVYDRHNTLPICYSTFVETIWFTCRAIRLSCVAIHDNYTTHGLFVLVFVCYKLDIGNKVRLESYKITCLSYPYTNLIDQCSNLERISNNRVMPSNVHNV